MRIVFYGTSEFAVRSLQALAHSEHEVGLVVTQPPRPAGRGRRPQQPPVKGAADELGLIVCQPPSPTDHLSLARVADAEPEVLVVAAYGHILKPALLEIARLGGINLHASLLPRYRGAAPIHRAIMAGESETGVTTIWMAPKMDAGDIILQRPMAIESDDTAGTLAGKLAREGADLVLETLDRVAAGTAPRTPQDEAQATYAPSLARADARINWSLPARDLHNLIRGANPKPGAFTGYGGQTLKVWESREAKNGPIRGGRPGEIVEIADDGVIVQTGDGGLCLRRVQPESRRAMGAAEFARGRRIGVGEVFE